VIGELGARVGGAARRVWGIVTDGLAIVGDVTLALLSAVLGCGECLGSRYFFSGGVQ
jgi:hypothetical protein